jgi:hypothetical protein
MPIEQHDDLLLLTGAGENPMLRGSPVSSAMLLYSLVHSG